MSTKINPKKGKRKSLEFRMGQIEAKFDTLKNDLEHLKKEITNEPNDFNDGREQLKKFKKELKILKELYNPSLYPESNLSVLNPYIEGVDNLHEQLKILLDAHKQGNFRMTAAASD